jgi:hypothetical protein
MPYDSLQTAIEKPTKGMWRDVAEAGVYTYMGKNYVIVQGDRGF